MKLDKTFFQDLPIFSHASSCGADLGLSSRAMYTGMTTESRRLLQLFDTVEPSHAMCTGTTPL
jgi:hypothetical protein